MVELRYQDQGGGGCFCWRPVKVESLISAIVSSEQASLTAPLKSPSSNFEDTRAARYSTGSQGRICPDLAGGLDAGSASSLSCLLTAEAKNQRRPPLRGTRKQRALKQRRRSHEAWCAMLVTLKGLSVT